MQKVHHFIKTSITTMKSITLSTPLAILLGSIIIALGIISYGFITKTSTTSTTTLFTGKAVDGTDFVEGNTKSNVVIVAYSDPECPYCISVYPTLKQLRKDYEDKVAFVYRHFPLTQIHAHAFDESRAIACAGALGGVKKFYEYIDNVYSYKSDHQTNQLPNTGKEDIARNIGLDTTLFSTCMKTNQTENVVTTSITDGLQAGVQGTPTTFVLVKNRKGYDIISLVNGARPYSYFKATIDEALNK